MSRLENFRSLATDHWYKKYFNKLTETEKFICEDFIQTRSQLSKNDYCKDVVRGGLGLPIVKNFAIMNELCLVAGTMESVSS